MRGLAILITILFLLVFMLPFVVSFVLFILFAVGIFMLLARMGLLPGFVFKTYRFTTEESTGRAKWAAGGDNSRPREKGEKPSEKSWYQDDQDGEIINLPETALKRDEK